MRHRSILATAALALSLLLPGAGQAQQPDRSRPGKDNGPPAVTAGFTARERQILADYFSRHRTPVKPLPPGIAKNLARGKPLPPGIAKQRLPSDLLRQLPPRQGFEIAVVGDRVVLLEARGLVVDILADLFR